MEKTKTLFDTIALSHITMLHGESKYEDWLYTIFHKENISSKIEEHFISGHFDSEEETVLAEVVKILGYNYSKLDTNSATRSYYFLANDYRDVCGLIFKRTSDGTKYIEVSLSTIDNTIVEKIDTYIKSIVIKRKTDGIFVISTKKTGLSLHSLGKLNYNFIEGNYENNVLSAYKYITNEYSKAQPYGRLSIVNGPPGTGKTNLIKGIISSVKNCLIVLLPSKFVSEVDSPALVTLLTEEKSDRYGTFNSKIDSGEEEDNTSRPILFIIEDADSCLVPRDRIKRIHDQFVAELYRWYFWFYVGFKNHCNNKRRENGI